MIFKNDVVLSILNTYAIIVRKDIIVIIDMVRKDSQREVVETETAPFELHSNNCRLLYEIY